MASNRGLSRITDTTLAEIGTSFPDILAKISGNAKTSVDKLGLTDSNLTAPLEAMRTKAITIAPGKATEISAATNAAISRLPATFNSKIPGIQNNTLYDLQQASRETLSTEVGSLSSDIETIAPEASEASLDAGLTSLNEAGNSSDAIATSAYSSAVKSSNDTVADVSNKAAQAAVDHNEAVNNINAVGEGEEIIDLPAPAEDTTIQDNLASESDPASPAYRNSDLGITSTSEDPLPDEINTTDVLEQEVKIYIEGVQVPYESYSVTQAIGQMPTARIQLPPQAGLLDIARFYQPKVHIFYVDHNTGGDRLLFWGHITNGNFSMSKQQGYATVSFECVHKNALMQQLTMEWSAGGASHAESGQNLTDTNPDQATVQLHNFNSEMTIVLALQGITGMQTDTKDIIRPYNKDVLNADPTKLDVRFQNFEKRMVGMPTSIMNLWNQMKKEVFSNEKLNLIFSKMYLPLIEDGIGFFDRLSGHYFLEKQIQDSKKDHCNDYAKPDASKYGTMVPPAFRMDTLTAVQTQMTIRSLTSMLGFSGEYMSFYDLFSNFYYGIEYELLTLASPAEVPVDPTSTADLDDPETWRGLDRMAIETIVKPQLPFYYAPVCNVLLPNMIHTIGVDQIESDIPTRVVAVSTAASQATNSASALGVNYRGPQSIRESVATGRELLDAKNKDKSSANLRDTTGSSYNIPGKYELGRGVKQRKLTMPSWLSHFSASNNETRSAKDDEVFPTTGSIEEKNLNDLRLAWIDRYGYSAGDTDSDIPGSTYRASLKEGLNPYSQHSGIMAYERLMFAAADYEYTKEVVKSKTGHVECIFNPYVVPGYPMDILMKSPNLPSFHAMCAAVTHTGSGSSISTSISFLAAITYTEMSNYFIQPIHPWLQTALKMINVSRDAGTDPLNSELTDEELAGPDNVTEEEPLPSEDREFRIRNEASVKKESQQEDLRKKSSTDYGLAADPKFDTNTGNVEYVKQNLIDNKRAKLVADQFYKSVLGVGATEPIDVYDFELGTVKPVSRTNGIWEEGPYDSIPLPNGGQGNDNLTGVGNLRLVQRQIESKKGIEDKFKIRFIDLTPENYNGAPAVYQNDILTNRDLLEPGASVFLDYEEITDFIKDVL